MPIKNEKFQIILAYIIIIGIIAILVFSVISLQNHFNNKSKGKYAEYIKENTLYKVSKVLDGDTIIAKVSNKKITLRLIGIDTPEIVDPRKPVQCYGEEASKEAKEILLDKYIYIEKESSKGDYDIYGRVLAYVIFDNGLLYNQYMIENGFAREYTWNKEKYKYQKEFKEAEEKAKAEKIGLWGKCK